MVAPASVSHRLGDKEGTIWHAASRGDLQRVVSLLNKDPTLLNKGDELGLTPLMWGVWEGRLPIVRYLLQQPGLDVNAVDAYNRTATYWAADYGRVELLRLLLTANADFSIARRDAFPVPDTTPIDAARKSKSPQCVLLLQMAAGEGVGKEFAPGSSVTKDVDIDSGDPPPAPSSSSSSSSLQRPPSVDTSFASWEDEQGPHKQRHSHYLRLSWWGGDSHLQHHHLLGGGGRLLTTRASPCLSAEKRQQQPRKRRKLPYLTPQRPFGRWGLWCWALCGRRRLRGRRKGSTSRVVPVTGGGGTIRTATPQARRSPPRQLLVRIYAWIYG